MTEQDQSIIELAETVKELVRIIQCFPNFNRLSEHLKNRLGDVYRKASKAKERVGGN